MKNEFVPVQEKKEKTALGILGAFLFSLAGGVLWVILDYIGFYAGLSGFVGAFCAVNGYRIFAGKLSKKGVIISVVIAFLVLILAWYGCLARDFMDASVEWFNNGETEAPLTYPQAFMTAFLLLSDSEILASYGGTLLIGLALAVVGSIRYIIDTFRSVGKKTAAQNAQQAETATAQDALRTQTEADHAQDAVDNEDKDAGDNGEQDT